MIGDDVTWPPEPGTSFGTSRGNLAPENGSHGMASPDMPHAPTRREPPQSQRFSSARPRGLEPLTF